MLFQYCDVCDKPTDEPETDLIGVSSESFGDDSFYNLGDVRQIGNWSV